MHHLTVLAQFYPMLWRMDWRPVAYASRTLSATERNYGHLDKEALAVVFAVKKFHQFLYGRHFKIYTDHKPLLGLLHPEKATPSMASSRSRGGH